MRTIIITILLALAICCLAFMLNRDNPEIDALTTRIQKLEVDMETIRKELDVHKAEIKNMVRPYTHIIPVSGGFLGVREK